MFDNYKYFLIMQVTDLSYLKHPMRTTAAIEAGRLMESKLCCTISELAKSVVEFNTVPATYKSEASVRGSEV